MSYVLRADGCQVFLSLLFCVASSYSRACEETDCDNGYPPFYRQIVGSPSRTKRGEGKDEFRRSGIMAGSCYYAVYGYAREWVISMI